MNFEDIYSFLEVCRHEGISQAAEAMFVAQSTVSQRIKRLEQEVGGELFERKPGIKGISLTPRGEMLLPIARKFEALSLDISDLSEREPVISLSIGSTTSVYDAILPELFCTIAQYCPGIQLSGVARSSIELYNMVQDRSLDMAFVSYEMSSDDIVCRPVFREDFYLIASSGLIDSNCTVIDTAVLDHSKELYYSFSGPFKKWHEQASPIGSFPMMKTDTLAVFCQVAQSVPFWSVCTASWVNYLLKMGVTLDVFQIASPPPSRVSYLIKNASRPVSAGKADDTFEKALSLLISTERVYPIT